MTQPRLSSIRPPLNTGVLPPLGYREIWACKFLLQTLLSILNIYTEFGILDHKAVVFFLSHLHTVSHSGYAILKSYQQRTQVPVSPYLCKYLVSSLFLIKQSASSDVWDFISMFLVYIALMISDFKHIFICLLAICVSSETRLFKSSAHFSTSTSTLLLLDTNPLLDTRPSHISRRPAGCLSNCHALWRGPIRSAAADVSCDCCHIRKIIINLVSWALPLFYFGSFIDFGLSFRSLIDFELIFVQHKGPVLFFCT